MYDLRVHLAVADLAALDQGQRKSFLRFEMVKDARFLNTDRIGQVLETHLGWAAGRLGFRAVTPVFDGAEEHEIEADLGRAWLIEIAWKDITERAWQIPFSSRVDSLTNHQHTVAEGDELQVGDLVEDAAELTQQDLDDIEQVALKEPALIHRLVSPESDITAINVTIELPGV